MYDLLYGLLKLDPVKRHVAPTALAYYAHLAANSHDLEIFTAAGMRFFQFKHVTDTDLQNLHESTSVYKIFHFELYHTTPLL